MGLYFFAAGVLAYSLLGLIPIFEGFDSRHQILLRFGSVLLLFYLITSINSENIQRLVVITFASLFIVKTISCQFQFQKSWFKQEALEQSFAKEKLFIDNVNFVIIDNTIDYNEYNKSYAFYCYTGILNKAFGNQTRFAIDSRELPVILAAYNLNDFISRPAYLMKDCKNLESFDYYALISRGSNQITNGQNLKMLYQYYFDKAGLENSLKNFLQIKVLPYK